MLFVGVWLRNLTSDIDKLREADSALGREIVASNEKIHDRINQCVQMEDFREYRKEQKDMFGELFNKLDSLRERMAGKADRKDAQS